VCAQYCKDPGARQQIILLFLNILSPSGNNLFCRPQVNSGQPRSSLSPVHWQRFLCRFGGSGLEKGGFIRELRELRETEGGRRPSAGGEDGLDFQPR
jgi:hypothetical protein